MNKSALKSHSAALFTVFIWGITFVCTKHLIKSFTSLEILFVRYAVAYIVLWALCPKTMRVQSKKEELYIFIAAMTGTALYQFLENLSVSYTSPSSVAFITATAPLFTAVLAHKYLHETLNVKIIVGMVVSIVGVFIICFGDSTTIETGLVGDIIIFEHLDVGSLLCCNQKACSLRAPAVSYYEKNVFLFPDCNASVYTFV